MSLAVAGVGLGLGVDGLALSKPSQVNDRLHVLPGTLSGASHDCSTWRNHGNKSVCGNNKQLIKIEDLVDEKLSPGDSC